MKAWDLEKLIFRLNLLITGAVFALLLPTTKIVAGGMPEGEQHFWRLPLRVVGLSCLLWVLFVFSKPLLFKWNVMEDRRGEPRVNKDPLAGRLIRMLLPVILLATHMLILIYFCYCLIEFMRSGTIQVWFDDVP